MCHGQWLDSHWARASTGRGRIACGGVNQSSHVMLFSMLFSCRLPMCPSRRSITREIGTCGSMAVISAIAFSAGYLPTLVHAIPHCSTGLCGAPFDPAWELIGMTLVSLMPLSSASAYDILCSSSRGSSRWPVFVVSGDLQPLGALSKAEIMETMYVISLWSMFPDRILLADWDWSIVPWCRLWWAVALLDWCMTLNSLPQMINAKGYGCITLAKFGVLFISRFRIAFAWQPDVM